ncbi:MAG TPA: tRNA threonylcarbamoyladenosine dehydratase [Bacteroidales bacterium]|nr:tRNA threonylcarbamoyladenosine dehydratase [Bacteroidales bacterium]
MHWLERTELLLGEEKLNRLRNSHVLVVGLGGVGAYAAEQICRAGVGEMTIVDGDLIHLTNINRQLPALNSSLAQPKAEYMGKRLLDINPNLKLHIIQEYIRDERMKEIIAHPYNYVVDAIDTLSPKIFLIHDSVKYGHKVVSSMGAGGKVNPSMVEVSDISESHSCPLARILRKRLHRLGIRSGIKVVFSSEEVPENSTRPCEGEPNKKTTVGTISYMPPIFGCFIASVVIRGLLEDQESTSLNHLV